VFKKNTATFTLSFAPIIFPYDLVPLIAKVANAADFAMNFRLFSIMMFLLERLVDIY
jgi:hypothetical protein